MVPPFARRSQGMRRSAHCRTRDEGDLAEVNRAGTVRQPIRFPEFQRFYTQIATPAWWGSQFIPKRHYNWALHKDEWPMNFFVGALDSPNVDEGGLKANAVHVS